MLANRRPFAREGEDNLCDRLVHALRRQGAQAEALHLPLAGDMAEGVIDEMLVARSLRLRNVDRVIALSFPAYLVPHANKVYWFTQPHPRGQDPGVSGSSRADQDEGRSRLHLATRNADALAFAEARAIHVSWRTTLHWLRRSNHRMATLLTTPVDGPELFTGGTSEGFIFCPGCVNAAHRQMLLVRAMRYAPTARLVIAGPPDDTRDADELQRLVAEEDAGDRVRLVLERLARAQFADLVNRSLAIAYLKSAPDTTGSTIRESFSAAKPVLTASDAGPLLELVQPGQTGYVAEPTPAALARMLRRIMASPQVAAQMGVTAQKRLAAESLDWGATVERLLA